MKILKDRIEYENKVKFDRFPFYLMITGILCLGAYLLNLSVEKDLIISLFGFINLLIAIYRYKYTKKRTVEAKLFEYSDGSIYHCFLAHGEADAFNLNKVNRILFGNNFIAFDGDYPFAKEIFFPNKYKNKINEIVSLIKSDHPTIEFIKN